LRRKILDRLFPGYVPRLQAKLREVNRVHLSLTANAISRDRRTFFTQWKSDMSRIATLLQVVEILDKDASAKLDLILGGEVYKALRIECETLSPEELDQKLDHLMSCKA